jgi:hypothetical protein
MAAPRQKVTGSRFDACSKDGSKPAFYLAKIIGHSLFN